MRALSLCGAVVAAALVTPADALACGGFFCSQIPIDQSAERIVFAVDDQTSTIDTHVQIAYTGSAEDFAWVVPVPAVPELFLSTEELFRQLSWRTEPRFWLQYREEGSCTYDDLYWPVAMGAEDSVDADGGVEDDGDDGVVVVAESQVGPYDTAVLQATSSSALLGWLQDNDYDLPSTLDPVLAPYVQDASYFVALRLQNDRDVGDIAPLGMRYQADEPMIPIQLTSIAATPDMRLEVYVLGDHRAVPDNYLHVRINEAAIDWLSGGANYEAVITQAADEAGGHAFATDFAGPTSGLQGSLWSEGRFDTAALAELDDPAAFVDAMIGQGFPPNDTVRNLLRRFIPMPAELVDQGVTENDFYNCLSCYSDHLQDLAFDAAGLAAALEAEVVEPLEAAEQLFHDHAKVSRLTSSISPVEMTVDPVFVFNATMADVSNEHTAELVYECGNGGSWGEAPRRIDLADGRSIRLPPESWFAENDTTPAEFLASLGVVAAEAIEDTSADGEPRIVEDRGALIDDLVAENNALVGDLIGDGVACAGCDGSGGGAWAGLSLIALLGIRRRGDRAG